VRVQARAAIIAVTGAFLAASCSGGSSGPPATINATVKDQLSVDAAVLQMSDLPGTWSTNRVASTASDALPTRDDVLTIADICVPTPVGITATTAREFLSGPTLGHVLVRGVVEAHSDAGALAGAMATLHPDQVKACLPQLVHTVFGDTAQLGEVSTESSTVDGVGQDGIGFRTSIHLSSGDAAFDIGADVVFARVDRFRATCTVISFDSPPDHALCADGLKAMVRRLSQ
jgi:hypothetical protein